MNTRNMFWLGIMCYLIPVLTACDNSQQKAVDGLHQTAFRFRTDVQAELNSEQGWAGAPDESMRVYADEPFRLRFELEGNPEVTGTVNFRLQYRRNGGAWTNVEVSDFPYPESRSPRVSIDSVHAYLHGTETTDLLAGSGAPFQPGVGINLAAMSPEWTGSGVQGEWEWPLVIRRYADGPVTNEEADTFELRMADSSGNPVSAEVHPMMTLSIPDGHLGGTFVETPGRLGPWEASSGDLYFIMEPTEINNVLMVVKSTDRGDSWREADGANRPAADDLEGFATDLHESTIHMLHQQSEAVWYHSFRTSDHPVNPNTWAVRDELLAKPGEPPVQVASMVARSDGSLVAVYGGPEKIRFKIRSPEGAWSGSTIVDQGDALQLSGPQAVLGENDEVHLAYTSRDGRAWYRTIQPDGTLSPRQHISDRIGTTEADIGSILPLVYQPETNTVAIIYRMTDGTLWERRLNGGELTDPAQITGRQVVQNAVDSDQAGADAIADGTSVHLLFIEDGSGSIYHTVSREPGEWQPPELLIDGINAQWIRGNRLVQGGAPEVYGFVYDAGSNGGTGMNKYHQISLGGD